MKKFLLLICSLFIAIYLPGQNSFTLEIEPYTIEKLPKLHSYVFGQYDGKWLIIGGRTSENEIEASYLNYEIIVIDPVQKEFWKYPLEWAYLNIDEPDHLAACHSSSYQEGELLYIAGGLGYSTVSEAIGTFPFLTVINVRKTISAVLNENQIGGEFIQFEEESFGVIDGDLSKNNGDLILSGGYYLETTFNEKGEWAVDHQSPRKVSQYGLLKKDGKLKDIFLKSQTDYGAFFKEEHIVSAPQIFPDGTKGITLFYNEVEENKSILNWMNVFDFGYAVFSTQESTLPIYHSTVIPIYDRLHGKMHTIFLGGCDNYMCTDEIDYSQSVVDKMDQFIRENNGKVNLDNREIISYLNKGKDAQFIPNPKFSNESPLVDLAIIPSSKTLIGYIYGGSTAPSPMFYEDGEAVDSASNQLFKVYLSKVSNTPLLGVQFPNEESKNYSINIPYK